MVKEKTPLQLLLASSISIHEFINAVPGRGVGLKPLGVALRSEDFDAEIINTHYAEVRGHANKDNVSFHIFPN